MSVASPYSVILFNFRGLSSENLANLCLLSGRKEDGGEPKDGVRALANILKDALANHHQTCLKIPRKAIIKMKSMYRKVNNCINNLTII